MTDQGTGLKGDMKLMGRFMAIITDPRAGSADIEELSRIKAELDKRGYRFTGNGFVKEEKK